MTSIDIIIIFPLEVIACIEYRYVVQVERRTVGYDAVCGLSAAVQRALLVASVLNCYEWSYQASWAGRVSVCLAAMSVG